MTIIFHTPTEWERFQNQIRVFKIEDVAAVIEKNRLLEMFGETDRTITLEIPNV
jgi:hypothetical protein